MSQPLNHQEQKVTIVGQQQLQKKLLNSLNHYFTQFHEALMVEMVMLKQINKQVFNVNKDGEGQYNMADWMITIDCSDMAWPQTNTTDMWAAINNNQVRIDHATDAINTIKGQMGVLHEHNKYLDAIINDSEWPEKYELSVVSQKVFDSIMSDFRQATQQQFDEIDCFK